MEKTTRRNLLRAVAAGGAAAAGIGVALRTGERAEAEASNGHSHGHGHALDGILSNVSVSFGHWKMSPPLDRFPNVPPAPTANAHLMTPNRPFIKAGGSVSFIISGLHNIQVFEPGTQPSDVNISMTTPMTGPAPFTGLPIINDSVGRIYRGPDPSLLPLDRVEVVNFPRRGRYLVICGFLFHFNDLMFGYVNVLP